MDSIDTKALSKDNDNVRLVACPNPFSTNRIDTVMMQGMTVKEMLLTLPSKFYSDFHVQLNDQTVSKDMWDTVMPRSGDCLIVRGIMSGGGGDGGKNPLKIILTIVVIVAAAATNQYWTLGGEFGAGVAAGVVSTVGMMAINALIPPPTPNLPSYNDSAGEKTSQTYSVTGSRNSINPYGPIPVTLGKHRFTPPYGALPYTLVNGTIADSGVWGADEQYLHCIFLLGYGPLEITDLRIGETPIDDFVDVQYQVEDGSTDDPILNYPSDVYQENFSITLKQADGFTSRNTQSNIDEMIVDLVFPQGLVEYDNFGQSAFVEVYVEIRTTFISTGAFETLSKKTWGNSSSTLRQQIGIDAFAGRGQYKVEVRRVTVDSTSNRIYDSLVWVGLKSIVNEDPITETGMARIGIKIRATEQLNGVIDTFNCIQQIICPDYDLGTDTWITRVTSNPASLFRFVLQGPANKRPLTDAEIDIGQLEIWHTYCDSNGFEFNHMVDYRTSVREILVNIASSGRAGISYVDGKYSVIIDTTKTIPVQHITPRNSWGYSGTKIFQDFSHAFKTSFNNADKDYQQDEIIVYDDGYTALNATKFETLNLVGITDYETAWKHARYFIAVARLRPENHSFYMDFENLVCTRGDLIKFSHDVPLIGLGWGRVKTVTDNGTHYTGVTLDEILSVETGKTYNIRFRIDVGSGANNSILVPVVNAGTGYYSAFTFTTPILFADPSPSVGDLAIFGESGTETSDFIIKSITPASDLTAKIECVDYSSAIFTSDTGVIPAFSSNITTPTDIRLQLIPVIERIRSDESVLIRNKNGNLFPQAVVAVKNVLTNYPGLIDGTELQYRTSGTDEKWVSILIGGDSYIFNVQNVETGNTYDFRARYKYNNNYNNWSTIVSHTIIGQTSPPPDVDEVYTEINYIKWYYSNPPVDFAGFKVRFRTGSSILWNDATPLHLGLVTETKFPTNNLPLGTGVIMVKAVDKIGTESTNPAYIIKDLGDPLTDNVITTYDVKGAGYPGTITDGTINGTQIEADAEVDLFWFTDSSTFWADDALVFWNTVYKEMEYAFTYTPTSGDVPSELSLSYTIVGSPYTIEYFSSGDGIFWDVSDASDFWDVSDASDFWDDIPARISWPGKIDATNNKYTFVITTGSGLIQGIISTLSIILDVPDVTERINDLAIGIAGTTRATLTKTYRVIQNVQLTLQDDGGTAVIAQVFDKNITTGPLIKCFDVGGNLDDGTVDVFIQGY